MDTNMISMIKNDRFKSIEPKKIIQDSKKSDFKQVMKKNTQNTYSEDEKNTVKNQSIQNKDTSKPKVEESKKVSKSNEDIKEEDVLDDKIEQCILCLQDIEKLIEKQKPLQDIQKLKQILTQVQNKLKGLMAQSKYKGKDSIQQFQKNIDSLIENFKKVQLSIENIGSKDAMKTIKSIENVINELDGLKIDIKSKNVESKNVESFPVQKMKSTEHVKDTKQNTDTNEQQQNSTKDTVKPIKRGFFANQKVEVTDESIKEIFEYKLEPQNIKMLETLKTQTQFIKRPNLQNILKQIVNQPSILLNEKGSEISIQLKPEHLGKLSMRIAVERGIVVANIVAENQGVKEVLESNAALLKDALTQKGLEIGQLNVNVGKDSEFSQQQNNMKNKKKVSNINSDAIEESDEVLFVNPNSHEDTKIDDLG